MILILAYLPFNSRLKTILGGGCLLLAVFIFLYLSAKYESKFKDHVVYASVLQNMDEIENNYKIMNLENPMISDKEKEYLDKVVTSEIPPYIPNQFLAFYNQDKLGGMIRNVEFWIKDIFEKLVIKE